MKLGELLRKMWNPVNFKGHVSPAEFMEAVSLASNSKFKCDMKSSDCAFGGQSEPAQFLAWILNTITERKEIDKHFKG